MAQFDYRTPLGEGEIRLLKLAWGEHNSQLKGKLLIRTLDVDEVEFDAINGPKITLRSGNAPKADKYEALSYPWGVDLREESKIMIAIGDKYDEFKPFNIRANLESALRLLRSHIKPPQDSRCIWVDALCINQNDSEEKSIQIPLMAEIYSHADNVCVWLGDPTPNSDVALAFIDDVLKLDNFDGLVSNSMISNQWQAFCDLLKRRWFGRRWIVQEIALARTATLYCGSKRVSWEDFADAVSLFSSRNESLRRVFKASADHNNHPDRLGYIEKLGASWLASRIDSLFRKADDGTILEHMFSLEELMSSLTLFEAGDPRDTLYAILWLANDVRPMSTALQHARLHRSLSTSNSTEESRNWLRKEANTQEQNQAGSTSPIDLPTHMEPTTPINPPPVMLHVKEDTESSSPANVHSPKMSAMSSNASDVSTLPLPAISQYSYSIKDSNSHVRNVQRTRTQVVQPKLMTADGQQFVQGSSITPPSPLRSHGRTLKPEHASSRGHSRNASASDSTLKAKNMVYNGPELTIEINYGKNIYEVCKDFVTHVFSRFGYIDMMCRPWAPESSEEHTWTPPSWMVTRDRLSFRVDKHQVYRREAADPLVGSTIVKGRRNYSASGQSRAFKGVDRREGRSYPPKIGSKRELLVRGLHLANITHITLPASDGNIPPEWLKFVGWNPEVDPRPPNDLWRTLVGDRGLDEISDPPRPFQMACKWAFQSSNRRGLKTAEELTYDECPSHMAEFLRRVQSVVWGRRLIIATCPEKNEKGEHRELLGLAPCDVEKDDLICILYGCSVPVLLRPQNTETYLAAREEAAREKRRFAQRGRGRRNTGGPNDTGGTEDSSAMHEETLSPNENWFKFIGECYVHGMMSGEVFSHKKKYHGDDLDEKDFEIR